MEQQQSLSRISEAEYRLIDRDSYSSIKTFIQNRRKYYRKYVLKEEITDEDKVDDSPSVQLGALVDCLLFSPEEKEDRFTIANYTLPTGQMLDFTKMLWKKTKEATADDGRVTREFASLAEEAYNAVAFDFNGNQVAFKQKGMNFQKVMDRFQDEGLSYYEHLRDCGNRYVIDIQDEQNAENIVRELRTNFATRSIVNAQNNPELEIYDQLVILWDYRGLPMKSMLDRLIVNHSEKKIFQYDLKTAWNVEGFIYNYLKLLYYIQIGCYNAAVLKWVEEMGLQDYEIVPMQFIVVDSTGLTNPLVYQTTQKHLEDSVLGFTINNRPYTGLRKAAEDLVWHKQMNLWTISRDNYDRRGIVTLNYNQ